MAYLESGGAKFVIVTEKRADSDVLLTAQYQQITFKIIKPTKVSDSEVKA